MELIAVIIFPVGLILFVQLFGRAYRNRPDDRIGVRRNVTQPKPIRSLGLLSPYQTAANLPLVPDSLEIRGRAWVIDGGTIAIQRTKIRLAGIDAPEIDMPWGRNSKWAMVNICRGQIITAKLTGERSGDRLIATCYLADGRDIGAELVKRGLALDLPRFSNGLYRPFEPAGARQKLHSATFARPTSDAHEPTRSVRKTG